VQQLRLNAPHAVDAPTRKAGAQEINYLSDCGVAAQEIL
jgi:hypothetical protein